MCTELTLFNNFSSSNFLKVEMILSLENTRHLIKLRYVHTVLNFLIDGFILQKNQFLIPKKGIRHTTTFLDKQYSENYLKFSFLSVLILLYKK